MIFEDAPTLRRGAQYLLFLTSFRNPQSFTLGDSWKDWEMPRRCVGAPNTFCSSLRFGILNPSHSETHGRIGRCPDVASGRPIPLVPRPTAAPFPSRHDDIHQPILHHNNVSNLLSVKPLFYGWQRECGRPELLLRSPAACFETATSLPVHLRDNGDRSVGKSLLL